MAEWVMLAWSTPTHGFSLRGSPVVQDLQRPLWLRAYALLGVERHWQQVVRKDLRYICVSLMKSPGEALCLPYHSLRGETGKGFYDFTMTFSRTQPMPTTISSVQ